MELVIDTNCLISALIKDSESRRLIFSEETSLYAPEHLKAETIRHSSEIADKSGLSPAELGRLIAILMGSISLVSSEEIEPFISRALEIAPHPEDAPFLALALLMRIPVWSDDRGLKRQDSVRVFSTSELLAILNDEP